MPVIKLVAPGPLVAKATDGFLDILPIALIANAHDCSCYKE